VPDAARLVGILLFDGVEELDAVGPYEVLAAWTTTHPEDGWAVTTMAEGPGPVTGAKGLVFVPHVAVAQAPPLDVLVYPGGIGTRAKLDDATHLEWVRAQRAAVPLVTSVCTGSLVLAAAGVLAGRPATTHWASLERLKALDPTIDVRGSARYVDDGDVVTAAGVSAGIDLALHLVARLSSHARAAEVRRQIQYDPDPPV